jgi:trehalose 6-phosphate synthase
MARKPAAKSRKPAAKAARAKPEKPGGGRLVVVSNRVPDVKGGRVQAGGLAVALEEALLAADEGVWFGWSGRVSGGENQARPEISEVGPITYITLDLTRKAYNEYYNGFANRTLWPLFHYRLDLAKFRREDHARYMEVNALFSDKLTHFLRPDDVVWVHDYHLIPLGECLRRHGHEQTMGIFLHTPFPAMEVLVALPSHRALVQALAAYDLIGFQTENDMRAFADYIVHEARGKVMKDGRVTAFGRHFRIGVFPVGITPEQFEGPVANPRQMSWARDLKERSGDGSWIIGVDRLDYSKGIYQRFAAFERMLERYPAYRGQVTFFQITPPSRGEVAEYKEIRRELEAMAGHINGRFADIDWMPLNYINKSYSRERLALFYRACGVGLVTPLRDGMNLVAKEYVASQNPADPGVLVLSRFAGAARELTDALIVNPYDINSVADAIAQGIEMPLDERRRRWRAMMKVIRKNDLAAWRKNYLAALADAGRKD